MPHDKTPNNTLIAVSNISPSQCNALEKWIADCSFEQYESPEYILPSFRKRPHNRLYRFTLPLADYRVVMKVVCMHEQYTRIHRLRALLKHYLRRDANYRAFECCHRAYRQKLAAPIPIAYWQKRDSLTEVKSYFLYRYVEDSMPWPEVSDKLKTMGDNEAKAYEDLLKKKIIDAVKCLHRAGIRHGDMVAHNILICAQDEDWARAKVCFIDYDRGRLTGLRKPASLKRFLDLRDLRKIYINDASPYDLLSIYLGGDYPLWKAVLAFWRLGSKRNDTSGKH